MKGLEAKIKEILINNEGDVTDKDISNIRDIVERASKYINSGGEIKLGSVVDFASELCDCGYYCGDMVAACMGLGELLDDKGKKVMLTALDIAMKDMKRIDINTIIAV